MACGPPTEIEWPGSVSAGFHQVSLDPMEHRAGYNRPDCSIGPMEGQWGATRRVRMWREGLVLQWGWGYGIRPNPNRRRYQTLPFQPNVSTTRAQVREHLGFRECSVADADKLTAWLAAHVANAERNQDRVREELFRRCRAEQIEPPAPDRVTRIVRSALHNAEETWFAVIALRVGAAGATGRVIALAGADDDDQDSVLALVKSVPGNVSLNSMLTEIRKLLAIRAIGLPPGLFADVAPKVVSSIWASATSLPIQMVYTYSWTPRRPSTSARVGPAERAPDWSCSASWCRRCQSAGSAAARVAMRHQPERKSSSAAKSTTGAWLIASSSGSEAATVADRKSAGVGKRADLGGRRHTSCLSDWSSDVALPISPAGEEVIQRRQVDDGRMVDRFELGIERGDVGGGQGRADGGEGPLDVRDRKS